VARGAAELFVLGVYPSALHARWRRPDGAVVAALAVDDEPAVFWDGADAAARIDRWRELVGWSPAWGSTGAVPGNGSSGRHVLEHVLRPLGVPAGRTHFTDCLPTYFVKRGSSSQTAAIRKVYDPFAARHGLPLADLPERPAPKDLVRRAVAEEGPHLARQLADAAAPPVVTLGQEAADVLTRLRSADPVVLAPGPNYGRAHHITLGCHGIEWLPLVHPGNRSERWRRAHRDWVARLV
jgi:hypothetical protein